MNVEIKFQEGKHELSTGRNGRIKTTGLSVYHGKSISECKQGGYVSVSPITSRGAIANCNINFPADPETLLALENELRRIRLSVTPADGEIETDRDVLSEIAAWTLDGEPTPAELVDEDRNLSEGDPYEMTFDESYTLLASAVASCRDQLKQPETGVFPQKITKWIRSGVHGVEAETVDGLLQIAGRKLDDAYSHEIMGEIVFEGEEGKHYVGSVEFVVSEANPEYVAGVLEEEKKGS